MRYRCLSINIQNSSYLFVILLRVGHDLGRFLALFLELFLGLAHLFFLLGDPLLQLQVLALEGPWRDLLLVEELVDALLGRLFSISDRLFPHFQHLGVLLWRKVVRNWLHRSHELSESVPLEDRATRACLWVPD